MVIDCYPGVVTDELVHHFIRHYFRKNFNIHSIRYLEWDRKRIYSAPSVCRECPHMEGVEHVLSVEYDNGTDTTIHGEPFTLTEMIFTVNDGEVWGIDSLEDSTWETITTLTDCVQYTFCEDPDINNSEQWMLALLDKRYTDSMRYYQFKRWKQRIENPRSIMSLKRDVIFTAKYGIYTNLNDNDWCIYIDPAIGERIFASPEEEKKDWMEQNEDGEMVFIPRQVKAMRIWNVKERCYEAIDPHLDGAPTAEEAPKYWEQMLDELRAKHGSDVVDGWLTAIQDNV